MNIIIRLILFSILMLPSFSFGQTILYVSAKGKDNGNGSPIKPFPTLNSALLAARNISGSIVIKMSGGTYRLSSPIIISDADARKENETLTVTNLDEVPVIITGSRSLGKLNWTHYKDNIYKTYIGKGLVIDQLFVNGQLQHMARYPNYDSSARFYNGTSEDVISTEKVSTWEHPQGGYLHALHRYEWGDFHYLITGKTPDNKLDLVGGWQNNRKMGIHDRHRFVENIFEELDAANEWYYDDTKGILYFYPPGGLDIHSAQIEIPQTKALIEFRGKTAKTVKNIVVHGIKFNHTLRTFMDNKEPLLRGDWTIYRGGALLFENVDNCKIDSCILSDLGGNAIFFNNYNRNCEISSCFISNIGASAVCFVGSPDAVRSPSFEYNEFVPLDKMDKVAGPKTDQYPANCSIYNNLIFNLGIIEKQTAGIQLSMCQSIIVSHNTIYDVPRAGINVNDGTWGGHIIEFNDVFNTVRESGDHGSFNSWGRDRYWHPDKKHMDSIVSQNYDLALLDVVKPIVLNNNRFRCDHGWDIDLDDGSSNYIITNNLCLNGGIKLREGVNRIVKNNIMLNNTFHPHVWFENSHDVFIHNVVTTDYQPIGVNSWGKEVDYNIFPDSMSLLQARARGTDQHSICEVLLFENPNAGDYRLRKGSLALTTGFVNFPMDTFGVVSPFLKLLEKKVQIPVINKNATGDENDIIEMMGVKMKNLTTLGERSATGMDEIRGVLILVVSAQSFAAGYLLPNDVILKVNNKMINNLKDLEQARNEISGNRIEVIVFRNQKEMRVILNASKS